jgi:mono/diheme cytochrome c family protein
MRFPTLLISALLLLGALLLVAAAKANPPQRVRVQQINPFLATTFQGFPTVIPTYGAAYNGQLSDAAATELAAAIRELTATLKGMNGSAAPSGKDAAPTKTDSTFAEGLLVLQTNCAKCHDKSVAAMKGNKFVLLDGKQLAQLTTDQALDVVLRIDEGSMPPNPNPPVADVDTAKVFKLFRQLKANTKVKK